MECIDFFKNWSLSLRKDQGRIYDLMPKMQWNLFKKSIRYGQYDNSDLNPSCDLLNMNCFWDFSDHLLYINLPWKILLKKVIKFLDLKKKIVLFWWRVFGQAPTSAILSTNKFSQIFKSKIETGFTTSSKKFQRNC